MDYLDLVCFVVVLIGLAAGFAGWFSLRWECRHLPEPTPEQLR
jgi:hypothetical protein